MIILTHRLYLKIGDADRAIDIVVRKPEPEPTGKAWTCRYEIDWPEGFKARDAYGLDALQALVLALEMIGAEIYTSAYHREGRLRAYDREAGYGFPVPSSLRGMLVGVDAI